MVPGFLDDKTLICFLIGANCDSCSNDYNGIIIALATLLTIAIIGLVISVVINVFLVVQHKQSRFVVTNKQWNVVTADNFVADMMLIRVMLDTVMSSNQVTSQSLRTSVLGLHNQSMKVLILSQVTNLIMISKWMSTLLMVVTLKWLLILLITSLVRNLIEKNKLKQLLLLLMFLIVASYCNKIANYPARLPCCA